ncbi:MAG: nuclear transport factor 2 family protein [Candidatus Riflebacteria bacterium]|nr:nuclear transport factor 2 family protein [Candidatus Riflebacteria bacterium]
MIDKEWARLFAVDWIDSWNSHNILRILEHYSDDFEMSSPLIIERLGLTEGKLKGKVAVRDYWLPSLSIQPPLRFELIDVLVGVSEVTIYYSNVGRRIVAETLFIDAAGKATHGFSQWSVS